MIGERGWGGLRQRRTRPVSCPVCAYLVESLVGTGRVASRRWWGLPPVFVAGAVRVTSKVAISSVLRHRTPPAPPRWSHQSGQPPAGGQPT